MAEGKVINVVRSISIGWMKLGLRARICAQCQPSPNATDPSKLLAAGSCEDRCPLFIQLPRLARFMERHRAKPPAGYEEFVIKLFCESSADTLNNDPLSSDRGAQPGPFLDHATDALAILERVASLFDEPEVATPGHDCARRAIALGQMSVQASKADVDQPSLGKPSMLQRSLNTVSTSADGRL